MIGLIILIILLILISFFAETAIFYFLTKVLKIQEKSFKTALLVNGIFNLAHLFLSLVVITVFSDAYFTVWLISFYIFYILLKKYYKATLSKSIVAYILLTISSILILGFFVFLGRLFVYQNVYMRGNAMEPIIQDFFSKIDF